MEVPQGKSAINRYQLKEQHLLHRYKEPCQNYDSWASSLSIWETAKSRTS